ncbi:hypothetical protein HYH03_015974 [Edaphochlamys debaryana]|uniref:Uncharacterized protein n=1 Tax=Edaphochlamys debaryana TaxID=47281 RepID=A0A835XQS7_9CHLO|nr:hypothetical protein HYH03_015974 [Edaphochlamys debaryana]|eukprot:KAG2485300.1 hypothetical protein HYH03_015974 [Edaphochlamys debaryana]
MDAPEPFWYKQFSIRFNETTKIFSTKHTEGTWHYDALGLREAIHRDNGQGDRYCGSIHPFTETPCSHIVVEGNRYLVFPDLGECCLCCTAAKGCGILAPTWLTGAAFQGTVTLRGMPAYKWRQDGLQPNYWYTSADEAQIPLELDQEPNDRQSLWPDSFAAGPPPDEAFALPEGCRSRCSLTSVCTIAAEAEGEAEEGQGEVV